MEMEMMGWGVVDFGASGAEGGRGHGDTGERAATEAEGEGKS